MMRASYHFCLIAIFFLNERLNQAKLSIKKLYIFCRFKKCGMIAWPQPNLKCDGQSSTGSAAAITFECRYFQIVIADNSRLDKAKTTIQKYWYSKIRTAMYSLHMSNWDRKGNEGTQVGVLNIMKCEMNFCSYFLLQTL